MGLSGTIDFMCRPIGDVDRRLACDDASYKAAVFQKYWGCILRQHRGLQIRCNESLLPRPNGRCPPFLCSAQMYCVVEDGSQYGLEVVRRTGDGAQHFRDSKALRSKVSYL